MAVALAVEAEAVEAAAVQDKSGIRNCDKLRLYMIKPPRLLNKIKAGHYRFGNDLYYLSEFFYHSVGEVTDKAVNTHSAESFDIFVFVYSPGIDFTAGTMHFINNFLT